MTGMHIFLIYHYSLIDMANKRQLTYIRKHNYIYSIEICIPTNPSKLQNKKYIIQSYSPVKALKIINI